MSRRFQANCNLFQSKNPRAATFVSLLDTSRTKLPEALEQDYQLLSPGDEKVLVVYGVGLGAMYHHLKNWLVADPQRTLIFLEDDLAITSLFLETETANVLLKDSQAHFYFIEKESKQIKEGKEVLQAISWGVFPEKVAIRALPYYEKTKAKAFKRIKNDFLYELSDIHATLDEYTIHGIPFFRNFWENIFLLPDSYRGNALFSQFKNIPAIVVAAGPSLNKHLEQLSQLQDRALIFAGGSSVNALTEAGIKPHFAAAIDPNPTQYLRLRQGLNFEIPFFYRHRVFPAAAKLITGPKLYLRGGDGYNTTDWFEKKLGIRGKVLGGGHSVANFSIEIAAALGCSPIILVGFDLAYTDQKTYASGVNDPTPILQEDAVEKKDIYGNVITTLWKWVLEANWISAFKKKKRGIHLYNATEGGIPIDGVKNISLQDAIEQFLTESRDLDGRVHTAIQEAGMLECSLQDIMKAEVKMHKSLEKTFHLLDKLLLELKKSAKHSILETNEIVVLLQEIHEEIAYSYIIEVFDRMRTKLDFFKRQFSFDPRVSLRQQSAFEKKQLIEHYAFLREVAVVNLFLLKRSADARVS